MVATLTQKILVSCFIEGEWLFVKCKYDTRVNQWLAALGARFDPKVDAFKLRPSVHAAKLLVGCNLEHVHLEASGDVRSLSQRVAYEDIDFETQPELRKCDSWRHQVGAYSFDSQRECSLWDMGMGTAKTKVAVDRIVNAGWKKTLVLCPATVRGVWRREIAKWAAKHVEVLVLDQKSWNSKRQAEESQRFLMNAQARNLPAVIVQNYESAIRPDFQKFALSLMWDSAICDESHRIGKPNSSVSKFCGKLGRKAKHRACLSGTPLGHSPLDIFGQARFLDPRFFGSSWSQFRNRYAVTGHFGADHIVSYKNMDELSEIMDSFTYRVTSDVLDLPEERHIEVPCELDKATLQVYREFEAEMCAAVSGSVITAANGLVKLLRLQQMTSGFIPIEDRDEYETLHTAKQDALEELLLQLDPSEPMIVFCKFTEDLRRVRELAEKTGRTYGEISSRQKDLTPEATMPEGITLMGVQIQSGGAGIDLTRACYATYYSVGYSLTDFDQSLKRVLRPGQMRPVTYYHLVTHGTVDQTIYSALDRRRDLVEAVLDRLKNLGN